MSDIEIPAVQISLNDIIDFEEDCVDPIVLAIIVESLDYAMDTAARRVKSAGKIFSKVEESAYGGGKGVLPLIKGIRNALLEAPQCTIEGPRVLPVPSPEEAIKKKIDEERTKPKKSSAQTIKDLEKVEKAVRSAKTTEDLLKAVKGHPELEAALGKTLPQGPKEPKKETPARHQPGLWGPAYFEGTEYESPQVLARELGIRTRGAKDMVEAFKRAGFEVTGNGKKVEKGKTKFSVKQVKPIPEKYRLVEETAEFAGHGKSTIKVPSEVLPEGEEPPGIPEEQFIEVRDAETKELIAYDQLNPATGLIIPAKRVWVKKPTEEAPGKVIDTKFEEPRG